MYLPRSLISTLYLHLQRTHHPLSPPVLILVALEPDALCGCRILTHLLKRDYIPHKIQPVAGYDDLAKAGRDVIRPMKENQGGSGGIVVCLGVGGMMDMGPWLGFDDNEQDIEGDYSGVEVWVIDARRPWNLGNVFAGLPEAREDEEPIVLTGVTDGKLGRNYKPGKGGIICFDDGDIEEDLEVERNAYLELAGMPPIEHEDGDEELLEEDTDDEEEDEGNALSSSGRKRKSWSPDEDEDDSEQEERPRQRRRSNSSSPIPESPSTRPAPRGLMSISGPPRSSASRSVTPTPAQVPAGPSARTLRRRLLKLKLKHDTTLLKYYNRGQWYSEPIASMMYSLASELGREDNDLLWLTIVGVTSMELYGRSASGVSISAQRTSPSGWLGMRGLRIRQLLRDEVRRLNPPELTDSSYNANRNMLPENNGIIPTTARSPTDTSIRLSPEPKFLLIRHWSLYDSMIHSPYVSARVHIWKDTGRKRLHNLLAKMGVSLVQCKQSYTHMDMELKRALRTKLLQHGAKVGLDGLVPSADTDGKDRGGTKDGWGFVRSWGWRATLSAQDVGVVVGAILEVGKHTVATLQTKGGDRNRDAKEVTDERGVLEGEEWVGRFWDAYDALENIEELKAALPTAQHLHRAILRTGSSVIEKKQVQHLQKFHMCLIKDGPDVDLFTHPAALTKLALWIGEAVAEENKEERAKLARGGRGTPLIVACLHESRGVYVVVGLGGGGGSGFDKTAAEEKKKRREAKAKERELKRKNKEIIREQKRAARRAALGDDEEDEEDETESEGSDTSGDEDDEEDDPRNTGPGRNNFGAAFYSVVDDTNATIRVDSFEHCVVDVKKEELGGFLEALSLKTVVYHE